MIQRIQSVYLLLASILCVVCLCLPVATLLVTDAKLAIEASATQQVYNLWIVSGDGARQFTTCPLFLLLLCSASLMLYTIFAYRNRMMQSRLCLFISLLLLGWHILYAVYSQILVGAGSGGAFQGSFAAVLPFVSLVLTVLARRRIIADEKLVRAADRIR